LVKTLLEVDNIHTYYGMAHILNGVSLSVRKGEVVCLMGRNGVGKTTTLRSIMSLTPPKQGKVIFDGKDITGVPAHLCARAGLALCPEGRHVFQGLSVIENLKVPVCRGSRDEMLKLTFRIFPELHERKNQRAGSLSGGEQQMLAIARALMIKPKLLLLDEPMEGLSPLVRNRILNALIEIKEEGVPILFTACTLSDALRITNRTYIMEKGRIVFEGTYEEVKNSAEIQKKYLGV